MSDSAWDQLRAEPPRTALVDGVEVRRGTRVRVHPRPGADVMDLAIAGRVGIVESLEVDMEGGLHVAVTLEDDPGRDLGEARQPGHRFFYTLAEVQPLEGGSTAARVLVAGIGNTFLGDDGFGVELARMLMDRPQPDGVEVKDFGIRGMALAFELADYDAALLLDAVPRGGEPGTLYVIDASEGPAEGAADAVALDAHGMDPVKVLRLARELGRVPDRVLIVGCEPLTRMSGEEDEIVGELSAPVRAALDDGARLAAQVIEELTTQEET